MIIKKYVQNTIKVEQEFSKLGQVVKLKTSLHEILPLLSNLTQGIWNPLFLSAIKSILHRLTDLKTNLFLVRVTLEKECLIHNRLFLPFTHFGEGDS
ncbi:MAG: hypothetical protein ACFFB2_19580 [Promethearchaeota archaeon]